MGNTMIQDSTTGNIMGLRDGFVPVGMKEYGGILYIASFNPQTQEGQLGTIPSPVINYTYNLAPYLCSFSGERPSDAKGTQITNIDKNKNSSTESYLGTSLYTNLLPKYLKTPFSISDKRFQVGDQFIVNLQFNNTNKLTRQYVKYISNSAHKNVYYNLISGFKKDIESNDINDYGLFKIVLEAKVEKSSDTINLSNISNKRQKYYIESKLEPIESNYWFINEAEIDPSLLQTTTIINSKGVSEQISYLPLDTERCQADNQYRTYPNILPGYLYVHVEVELPENFEFFKNNSTGLKSPNVFSITLTD